MTESKRTTHRATSTPTATPARAPLALARRWLIAAWVAVALIPFGVGAAFVIGSGLAGGDFATSDPGVILRAGIPAVLIMLVAPIAAMVLGSAARRRGARAGIWPLVIGIAAAAWAVITNTLPLLLAPLIGG